MHVPTSALKPNHHGAGLIDVFQMYRSLVEEFKHELFFRGFLIAFGHHVRETLKRDSDSHPVTHWWRGSNGEKDSQFVDSSQGYSFVLFGQAGRQQLALNLAKETFKALDLYFTYGYYKSFLESAAKLTSGSSFLEAYLEDMPEDIAVELVPEPPRNIPAFAMNEEAVEAERVKKISDSKLSKRPPEIEKIAPGKALTSAQRESLRWSRLSEDEKQAERDKKAARRKELRAAKKVKLC